VLNGIGSATNCRSFLTSQPIAIPTASPPIVVATKAPAAQARENEPGRSGAHRHSIGHERSRIVEESFTLEYRDEARGQAEAAHDLSCDISVRGSHDGAENERRSHGIRGAMVCAAAATAAIVSSTSATASRKMGRAFCGYHAVSWSQPLDREGAARTERTSARDRSEPWENGTVDNSYSAEEPELSPAEYRSGAQWAAAA